MRTISVDANGVITQQPTHQVELYTITYQLCEVGATPANCDTATVVVVGGTIFANDDSSINRREVC
jgi:hypothetical protein